MGPQYSYSIDLIAQTSKFEQNMQSATGKIKDLAKSTQDASGEVVNLTKKSEAGFGKMGESAERVMGSLGSAIGGVNGDIIGLCGALAGAMGPIAILTAGIGAIAMAWKNSEENVKSYLERVETTKMDPAIFSRSSKDAYNDSVGAAKGGVTEGLRLMRDAQLKLSTYGANYTEEQKKQLELQKELGFQMLNDNTELLKTLGHEGNILTNKVKMLEFVQQYNKLQSESKKLEEDKISSETERNNLETELIDIRTQIMSQEGTIAEREKLKNNFIEKANLIANNKLAIVNREFDVTNAMYKMTGESDKASLLSLNTDKARAQITKDLAADIGNTVKLMNAINKAQNKIEVSVERELSLRKEINSSSEAGYKLGTDLTGVNGTERSGFANTGQALKSSALFSHNLASPEGINNLRKYNALTKEQIDGIVRTNAELERQQNIADGLTNIFSDMFRSIDGGFEAMAKSLIQSIEQIAAELMAKAAVFAIMSLIPGMAPAGTMLSFMGLGKLTGLADGGLAYGPTIAQVGEYAGAKSNPEVIAPLSKLKDMLKPAGAMNGRVVFEIGNRVITGVLEQEGRVSRNIRGRG